MSTLGIKSLANSYPAVKLAAQPSANVPNSSVSLALHEPVVFLPNANYTPGATEKLVGAVYSALAYTGTHNLVLPSGADLLTLLSEAVVGSSFKFNVINNGSSGSVSLVLGSGGSSLGSIIVLNGASATFRVVVTSVDGASYQVQRLV